MESPTILSTRRRRAQENMSTRLRVIASRA